MIPSTRYCPQGHGALVVAPAGSIEVDRCPTCAGVFFDPGELAATLGADANPETWGRDPSAQAPDMHSAYCPAGHGPMWRLPTEPAPGVPWVQACGHCRGVWIEHVTLENLRARGPKLPMNEGATADSVGRYLFQLVSFMPVEVSNPVHRRPWVTWSLAASMVAAYAALHLLPVASRLQWEAMLMVSPSEIRHGFGLLTPISYAWIHTGVGHLLGNLYFFLVFGDNIEDRFGRAWYLAMLAVSAVLGALVEVAARGDVEVGVGGASGAVAGVLGAYMVLFPQTKLHVVLAFIPLKVPAALYLAFWAAVQVYGYLQHTPGIAWLAHVGGFFVGLAAAIVARASSRTAVAS
ncbi:MAG: rhomboid family intramembrane serine protease [Myxococcaceae bacterium]|nr:MAG: rhomboid family intramembrane serine protease [Myxococcaceae bacterium]